MTIVNELWVPFSFVQLLAIDISRHAIDLSAKEKKKKTIDALHQLESEPITFHMFIPMLQFKAYAFVPEGGLMP